MGTSPSPYREKPREEPAEPEPAKTEWWPEENKAEDWLALFGILDFFNFF